MHDKLLASSALTLNKMSFVLRLNVYSSIQKCNSDFSFNYKVYTFDFYKSFM